MQWGIAIYDFDLFWDIVISKIHREMSRSPYGWVLVKICQGVEFVSYSSSSIWSKFYQTRPTWSMDQGSTNKGSVVHNFVPTVTKFCVMWEGLSFPHDTKFGNCRGAICWQESDSHLKFDSWIKLDKPTFKPTYLTNCIFWQIMKEGQRIGLFVYIILYNMIIRGSGEYRRKHNTRHLQHWR